MRALTYEQYTALRDLAGPVELPPLETWDDPMGTIYDSLMDRGCVVRIILDAEWHEWRPTALGLLALRVSRPDMASAS